MDERLTTLLSKKNVAKAKELETGWPNSTESSKEGYGSTKAVLPMIIMIKIVTHDGILVSINEV